MRDRVSRLGSDSIAHALARRAAGKKCALALVLDRNAAKSGAQRERLRRQAHADIDPPAAGSGASCRCSRPSCSTRSTTTCSRTRWCCSSSTASTIPRRPRRSSARSPRACSSCRSSSSRRSPGQLADMRDKARIIRWVKLAEIGIMMVGAAGLLLAWQGLLTEAVAIPLMLLALFAMGVHSTFFGPIKYAILPQHLQEGRSARRHRPGRGGHLHRDPRRHDPRRLHPGRMGRRGRRRHRAASAT